MTPQERQRLEARVRYETILEIQAVRTDLSYLESDLRLAIHQITDRHGEEPAPGWTDRMELILAELHEHNAKMKRELDRSLRALEEEVKRKRRVGKS